MTGSSWVKSAVIIYVKESHLAYPGFEVEGTEMAELRKHNASKQDYQLV